MLQAGAAVQFVQAENYTLDKRDKQKRPKRPTQKRQKRPKNDTKETNQKRRTFEKRSICNLPDEKKPICNLTHACM